ncbi:hypothetical protein YK48G_06530 [Lentilactobacillus fungorum]|uniref:Uncharacterized protein n=1 Tax=Lentilactobacillus fungorum TaxID=2201250 RepID=A0ABQ3VX19_9LACO|nr:DUF6483 family protein [Lentilactobacillus fungorum]GHP13228.1 hypothetical protein YK48G_06530 [Lentilactobacillus fungorum]
MQQDEDFLTRQIRSIGQGLGVMISGKNGGPTQIVFPKKQAQKLPHQVDLQRLIDEGKYGQAAEHLVQLEFAISHQDYFELSLWLYKTLNQLSDETLRSGQYSKTRILDQLQRLKNKQ